MRVSSYKQYPVGTKVFIVSTGETGEAFESAFGYITVFVDGERKCRLFELSDVKFFEKPPPG